MATYVVSDLHGHFNEFMYGLGKINFDFTKDILFVLGDCIDRGPDGIRLLNFIRKCPNMELLLGNHELMMMHVVARDGAIGSTFSDDYMLWVYYNHGKPTLRTLQSLPKEEREALMDWLYTRSVITSFYIDGKHFTLTHSSYNADCVDKPFDELEYSDVYDIVWRSRFRRDLRCSRFQDTEPNTTFICGHVPQQSITHADFAPIEKPWNEGNLYDIDGGLPYGRGNSCAIFLRLEDMTSTIVPIQKF